MVFICTGVWGYTDRRVREYTFISELCLQMGPTNKEISVAMSTSSAQIVVSK